jgi:hypothetical protein
VSSGRISVILAAQAREIRATGSSRILRDVRTITYDLLKQIETTKKIFADDDSVQTVRTEEGQVWTVTTAM